MSTNIYNNNDYPSPRVKYFGEIPVFEYELTDSTNDRAKEYAARHPHSPAVFIAREQTKGRGRRGRSFISEGGRGLYMSILSYPNTPPDRMASVTAYMAVIAADAISAQTGVTPLVKWVNDLYLGDRKLAGILTEGAFDESGKLSGAVVGIGINLFGRDMPTEIADIATSLEREGVSADRDTLAKNIADLFFLNIEKVGSREIADRYRSLSFLIGSKVTVHKATVTYDAQVLGITDSCELILLLDNGERELLSTGEVSVRKKTAQNDN